MDLDEWAGSKVTSEFFQIDPKELAPPSEKTTARVMYDDKNITKRCTSNHEKPAKSMEVDTILRMCIDSWKKRRVNWMYSL